MTRRASLSVPTRSSRPERPVTLPVVGTALLLIEVINDLAFEGSEALVAQAEPMAIRLAALKRRATAAANDAYMRELKIFAPADCIVSNTAADNHHALRQIGTVLKGNVAESRRLGFRKANVSRTGRQR